MPLAWICDHITLLPPFPDSLEFYVPEEEKNPTNPYRYLRRREPKKISKSDIRHYKNYQAKKLPDMFSYGEISIRPGNIGYVEVFGFHAANKKEKNNEERVCFKDVMSFFRNTPSIIIDFRSNYGGNLALSAYFASFFVHKPGNYYSTLEERFVSDTIPNGHTVIVRNDFKYPSDNTWFTRNKKIYLLVSNKTFSAGSEVAYQLKKSGTATIIGELCKGPGNAHHGILIRKYYNALVPTATHFDLENDTQSFLNLTVIPDIVMAADTSMDFTLRLIKQKNKLVLTDSLTLYYKVNMGFIKAAYPDTLLPYLDEYEGDYQKAKIKRTGKLLYLEYDHSSGGVLYYVKKDEFKTPDNIKVRFIRDKAERITAVEITTLSFLVELFRKV